MRKSEVIMFQLSKCKVKDHPQVSLASHEDYALLCHELNELKGKSPVFEALLSQMPSAQITRMKDHFSEALQMNMIGMAFVSVVIDHHMYRFLLDTGAQVSCVHKKHLKDYHKRYGIDVADASGKTSNMSLSIIDELQVLNVQLHQWPIIVLENNTSFSSPFGAEWLNFDGIIGWDILRHLDFEIDYKHQIIRSIHDVPEQYEKNMISMASPSIVVTSSEGHLLVFSLDTGSKTSWLNKRLLRTENLEVSGTKEQNNLTVHGIHKQKINVIKSFKIYVQNKALHYQNIKISDHSILNGSAYDGIIGYDAIKHHKIGFVNSKQFFYIK